MESISDMLVRHEGLRLRVYNDSVGIPTIGVGRNLRDRGLTKEEAMYLLDNDIKDFTKQLSDRLDWFDFKPIEVRNVLIDMGFNLGIAGLMSFTNTLSHIEKGNYKTAAITMLESKWAKQVGNRAIELSNILKMVGV
jgi:lysozyme